MLTEERDQLPVDGLRGLLGRVVTGLRDLEILDLRGEPGEAVGQVRTTGPVILSRCSLRETTFDAADLSAAAFNDCDLRLTEFDGGKYRGLDLRGNDVSQLRGLASFKQVIIDRTQTLQLAEALAAELDITYGEDLDEK